jgi:enoyl-CoA hydratase/carnithine racemase
MLSSFGSNGASMESVVLLTKSQNVFIININDEKENRLTTKTLQQFHNCLDEVEKDFPLGLGSALVTVGTGKYFSNGIELTNWNAERLSVFSKLLYSLLARILVFPIPTLAVINGHASGAGTFYL